MAFQMGPNHPDPRHEPTLMAEGALGKQGELELRQRRGELAIRHGYGTVRGRWRRWLSRGALLLLGIGAVAWLVFALTGGTSQPDVALEDDGTLVEVLSPGEATARAAAAIGAEQLLLPIDPAGEDLSLIKLNVVRDGNGVAIGSIATYWPRLVYRDGDQELLVYQFAPGVDAEAPGAETFVRTIGSSTVRYSSGVEPVDSIEAPGAAIGMRVVVAPLDRRPGLQTIAQLEPSTSYAWYLVEGTGHPPLFISVRGHQRPLPADVLAMIESLLEDAG